MLLLLMIASYDALRIGPAGIEINIIKELNNSDKKTKLFSLNDKY